MSVETAPENGSLTLNADGTYEYVPDNGWSGLDRFWYEVNDGNGNTEVVEVCIYTDPGPNALPETTKDDVATEVNTSVSGNVLSNDVDPDNDEVTVDGSISRETFFSWCEAAEAIAFQSITP